MVLSDETKIAQSIAQAEANCLYDLLRKTFDYDEERRCTVDGMLRYP